MKIKTGLGWKLKPGQDGNRNWVRRINEHQDKTGSMMRGKMAKLESTQLWWPMHG